MSSLESASLLQQSRELSLLGLELGVAANVLLADEDVGDSALAGDLLERSLDVGAVVYEQTVSKIQSWIAPMA